MKVSDFEAVLDALLAADDVLLDAEQLAIKFGDRHLAGRCTRAAEQVRDAIHGVLSFRGAEKAADVMYQRGALPADVPLRAVRDEEELRS